MLRFFTRFICFILILWVGVSSCQKDENATTVHAKAQLQTDSVKKLNSVSAAGNYLASKGTLKIKVQDSTYTFDASQDSVAFINETINGKQYFGVTAINKAHTVSFGISSSAPIADMYGTVAGAQFLMHVAGKANIEYTLTHNTPPRDYGSIKIEKYKRDTILAIGTFHTYLAKDSKPSSPFFIADGSFDLEGK